jgi:hypothetical protein
MGYTTNFTGSLGFKTEPTASQLAALNEMFGEDCRSHPEWDAQGLYYVDLELTKDFKGVTHDGSEKTYDLEKIVNVVTNVMRKTWPDFSFTGSMAAQGEEADDRWQLFVNDDGIAEKRLTMVVGTRCVCPDCGHKFIIEAPAVGEP